MKLRIPIAEPVIGEREIELVTEALKSGWVSSQGRFVKEFESNFAEYIRVRHGIAVSNGTAALHLALVALDIKKGDEVLIPTLTFASVANVVIYTGAKPVFIDSNPTYWCIDPSKIEENITKKTKAIMPVHLYGHPCDMEKIMKIAKDNDLYIIEDCAEAHGALYEDKNVGSFGDISCFSFYGNKVITTGEGGICLTNDEKLAEKMVRLRDHGMSSEKKYWHDLIGYNYRLTNLQAALGVAQLEKIDSFIRRKREIVKLYNTILKDIKGIELPPEMSWAKNVYWMYSILINEKDFGMNRYDVIAELEKYGIETRRFFYPIHTMPPYRRYSYNKCFEVADQLSSTGMNLPSSTKLKDEEVEYICKAILNMRKIDKGKTHLLNKI